MSMKVMDQIGQKEYFAILLIIIGLKVTDMTPSLIYPDVLSSSWMVPVLSYLILLIPISFLCHLLVKLDKGGLYEVNGKVFGKALGNLLNIIFLGILFAAIVIDSRSYVDLISTMYFEQSPVIFIYFLFMLVCYYGAKKGLEAIGTVSWLSFFYLEAAILFSLILMLRIGDFNRMFPILGPGVKVIAQESFSNLSLYGEVFVLAFIFPFIYNVKKFKKTTMVGLSVVMVKLFIFFIVYLLLFDYPSAQNITYPFHEAIRNISLGYYLDNLETLFLPFWLIGTFIKIMVFLYLLAYIFSKVVKIDEFEHLLFPLAVLVLLTGMIPENAAVNVYKVGKTLFNYSSYFFLIYPILLWIFAKGRKLI